MLSSFDLIKLPYTQDLTRAGIVYACRSLPHTYDRMGGSHISRLRRIVAGKAVELAFRRCLFDRQVPFDNLGATHFTDPDRYDISLGGRRCDIKSFQFLQKERIRRLRRDPEFLLAAAALVPDDQVAASNLEDEDVYIFAFVTALVTSHPGELLQALAAGQPAYLIHPLPQTWARPATWRSLGQVLLKQDGPQPVSLELGGQGKDRDFQTELVTLPPDQRVQISSEFYSLAYLHASQQVDGKVSLYSSARRESMLIQPLKWDNIWVYGMEVILAGYMLRGEFRHRARRLPAGSRVLQYARTKTANLALPVKELYPLDDLFGRAKAWANRYQAPF
jgi:hypothetical protein